MRSEHSKPGGLPLSFAQQRLWFLDQLGPGSPRYNVPLALRLTGPLRLELLQRALNEVVARHEALRTNFVSADGQPSQVIRAPEPVPISIIDLSHSTESLHDGTLRVLLTRQARQPFDLAAELLIRPAVFRLAEQEHILLLNMHHIVCDEWSLRLLLRELTLLYRAFAAGQKSPLLDLPIQYADFAAWQRDWVQGRSLRREFTYWNRKLSGGNLARLELPADRPHARTTPDQGSRETLDLTPGLVERLRELSRREGVTLFMALLTSFQTLLARWTGAHEISVGSPFFGRTRVETEELIGFFVNTLILRTDLSGEPTFLEVLRRVRDTTIGACDHQDFPFEKLVEELHPERFASRIPFIQVMFALQRTGELEEGLQLPGLNTQWIEVDTETAKFDLTCVVREKTETLTLSIEYATHLFTRDTIVRLLGLWPAVLEQMVRDPGQKISELCLVTPEERRRLLVEWNSTRCEYPGDASLAEVFASRVGSRADALAVRYGPFSLSFRELHARSNQLAHRLRDLGVGPGVRVGLYAKPSIDWIAGMLGIIKAGGAYVPLEPSYPPARLRFILEDTQAAVVLTQGPLLSSLPQTAAHVLCLDSPPPAPAEDLPIAAGPDDLACVIYTSGSTGRPKGVLVPHRAILRLVCNTDYVRWTVEDRVAQASHLSFDAATFEIWGALLNGAALIGIECGALISPTDLAAQLAAEQITTLFLTTAKFNQMAAEVPGAFKSLRQLLFGGERADPESVRRVLNEPGPERLVHVYGPTEATTFASWHLVTEVPDGETVPIGRPIANTTLYVLDPSLQPVPVGVPGELHIGGPGVARGYLHLPDLTAEKFIPDPFSDPSGATLYKTGDRARHRADGTIEFLGRLDDQVKIRGFRVEPGEIEAVLASHPAVHQTVVVARDGDPAVGKSLAAYLVFKEGHETSELAAIGPFLREQLPSYMIPANLIHLPSLPLNAAGKVERSALPAPESVRPEWRESCLEPRTPTEVKLAELWSEVLGMAQVGLHDSFFDLGGHSLLAVRLLARIEKTFGRKLPLAALFQTPTIAGLAEFIRAEEASASWPLLVEIQPEGSRPPIFWVHSLGGDGGGAFCYYRKLAQLLGPDQPSIGIRSPREPCTQIETMAARYTEELLQAQPNGPYFLGGFCFGGVVAFEMACQLRSRGREVGLLALLESALPRSSRRRASWRPPSAGYLADHVRSWFRELGHQGSGEIAGRLQHRGKALGKRLRRFLSRGQKDATPELGEFVDVSQYPEDYIRYAQAHLEALMAYRPRIYPGRIILFRARKQPLLDWEPALGWGALAEGGVAVNVIPGTHEMLLTEPNVHILAAELKTCLAEGYSLLDDTENPEPLVEPAEAPRVTAASRSRACSIIT